MRFTLGLLVFTIALVAGAPAQTAKPIYSTGSIQASCAPWDGPAIAMTIATNPFVPKHTPEPPYLNINIWKDLPLHDGQVIEFNSTASAGSASRCLKEGSVCDFATDAEIRFDKFKPGSGATGHYELHLKNGETVSGSFDVKWVEMRMICG